MPLFSDGPPSTVDDLAVQDSFLLQVASTEGIDVSAKLQSAFNEVGIELLVIFGREASIYAPVLGQAPLDTQHLSVTPALKLWHTFKSLELVYRDCYFNQLNDRYKAKWAEYQSQANGMKGRFIDTGAGLVIDPLPQPGMPAISFQTSTGSGGTFYVCTTLVNVEGEESSPSVTVQAVIPNLQQLVVAAGTVPVNATGWNLYGGMSPVSMTLQTVTPMTPTSPGTLALPLLQNGKSPGTGQAANVTRDLPRRIMRG